MLRAEIEERELAEARGCSSLKIVCTGDSSSSQIVLPVQIEFHVGIGTSWHNQVEDDGVAAKSEVEHASALAIGLRRLTEGNRIRNFAAILVETNVFERRRCAGKELWREDNARRPCACRKHNGPLVSKKLWIGDRSTEARRYSLPEKECEKN
jgi:hypothetical protein